MTLNLPYGPTPSVTGPNPNPITLVGLRKYSSPNCNPLTGTGCPVDGVPVFSNIFSEDTVAHSNYNSLQARMQTRFSKGGIVTLSYTWAKSLTDGSAYNYQPQDSTNIHADYGPANFSQPKIFVARRPAMAGCHP